MKHVRQQQGFTLIEMIFCISVILVILLLVIPEVTGCKVNEFKLFKNDFYIKVFINDYFFNNTMP